MSDSEASDIHDDDDLVRQYERDDDGELEQNKNHEDGNISNEEVNDEDENKQKVDTPVSKKRITRKLHVLNTERLKGNKGIHTIEKLYEGFKFKGKGYEKEDLNRVMKRLEYWAFRLFPKLDFDDFLSKCEHLGHKKDLHTHLKKYRLGMITANDIITENDMIEDEKDDPVIIRTEKQFFNEIANDNFQRLFDENQQSANDTL